MAEDFARNLRRLIRARFPLLSIQTAEESRVLAEIAAVVGNRTQVAPARQVYTWSTANGFAALGQPGNPDTRTPHAALTAAAALTMPSVVVLLDLHPWMGSDATAAGHPVGPRHQGHRPVLQGRRGAAHPDPDLPDAADPAGPRIAGHPGRLPAAHRAADQGNPGRDDRPQHGRRCVDGRASVRPVRSGSRRPRSGSPRSRRRTLSPVRWWTTAGSPTTTSPSSRRRSGRSCRSPGCWRWSARPSRWMTSAAWRT